MVHDSRSKVSQFQEFSSLVAIINTVGPPIKDPVSPERTLSFI